MIILSMNTSRRMMMTDDMLERMDEEYWLDTDEEWRELVCNDNILSASEYHEYLDAWWAYSYEEDEQ